MMGVIAARIAAPASAGPRARNTHAPSASVYSCSSRSRRIRAWVSSRPTDAFARRLASLTCASGTVAASSNKRSVSAGATSAAELTNSALRAESSPARNACSTFGCSATRCDVSSIDRADDTDVPDRAASCSATDRNPS